MKLKNGQEFEISQDARDQITSLLIGPKENRPEFIDIQSVGVVVSVSTIATIIQHRVEPQRVPTQEEELAEFNARWEAQNSGGKG